MNANSIASVHTMSTLHICATFVKSVITSSDLGIWWCPIQLQALWQPINE